MNKYLEQKLNERALLIKDCPRRDGTTRDLHNDSFKRGAYWMAEHLWPVVEAASKTSAQFCQLGGCSECDDNFKVLAEALSRIKEAE